MADPEETKEAVERGADILQVPGDVISGKKAPKRRSTAYQRKYKAAFKKIASRYKLKSGKWKKGGFKAAVRAAHKAVKK